MSNTERETSHAAGTRPAPDGPGAETSDDVLLAELCEEVTRRAQAGESVDLEAYAHEYPERAATIEKFLPTLALLVGLGSETSTSAGTSETSPLGDSATGKPDQTLGDFRIVREIGRGGMGVVYEAKQLSLGRKVALKVLPFASVFDRRQIQRFQTEAQAAAQLHHQHIVPVFAVGCDRGVHYYAMQFIEGQTLGEAIAELRDLSARDSSGASRRGAVKPPGGLTGPTSSSSATRAPSSRLAAASTTSHEFVRAVVELGIQAADALAHAHQSGVLHRDIKPANLLLDARGNVWITDFGLARFEGDTGVTLSGDVLGTLRYMSPEQALGQRAEVDERSDVYSLGVTLYELLTLEPAVSGKDREQILRQVAFEDPPPPRRLRPAVPQELETIVLKAIEKNPRERYAGAAELAEDLRLFLADKPIRAQRPTTAQRLVKWARRHRALVASLFVACTVALLLLAAGGGGLALYFRGVAQQNREVADHNEQVAQENQALAEERRESLVRSYVVNGSQLLEDGDVLGALVWFTKALDEDPGDLEHEAPHRMRIASTLARCPRLGRIWGFGEGDETGTGEREVVAVSPDGRRLVLQEAKGWTLQDAVSTAGPGIARFEGNIQKCRFSPNGSRLVTDSEGRTEIRDAGTGALVASLERTDGSLACRPIFSDDSRRVATLTQTKDNAHVVEVWNASDGALVGASEPIEAIFYRWLALSPDGDRVAFNTWSRLEVLDAVTGKSVIPPDARVNHGYNIQDFHFGPEGRFLATAGQDGVAQVFRTDTWERVFAAKHPGALRSIDFSPDGRVVVTSGKEGIIRIWAIDSGRLLRALNTGTSWGRDVRFSPDGRWTVSVGAGVVKLWEFEEDRVLDLPLYLDQGKARFSSDGRFLLVRSPTQLLTWDFAATESASPALRGSRSWLIGNGYLSGSRYQVKRIFDGKERVMDRYLGQTLNAPRSGSPDVWLAVPSPDGRFVATGGLDGTARVWDAETFLPVTPPLHHEAAILRVSFDPRSRRLLTVAGRSARLWDAATGAPLAQPLAHAGHVIDAVFSPDGRLVATAGDDGTARLWDPETAEPVGPPLDQAEPLRRVLFHPDGRYLLTSTANDSHGGHLYLWDVATRQLKHKLGGIWATHASFRPDGEQIVAGFAGVEGAPDAGHALVFDVESGERRLRTPTGHACCERANFNADATLLVTTGIDWKAVVRDPLTGSPRLTLPHRNVVFDARFSPDHEEGRWLLLTASFDGVARLWDARTGEWITPALEHHGRLRDAVFSSDGNRVLTASRSAHVREIPRDERPVEELLDLARLLSGRCVDPAAIRLVANEEDWLTLYRRVLARNPDEILLPRERALAWHQRKADEAIDAQRWEDALVHLEPLIEAEGWRYPNLVLRGHARAELGRLREAAADFESAVAAGETDPWIQHCAALAWLASDELERFRSVSGRLLARLDAEASAGARRWLGWTFSLAPAAVGDFNAAMDLLEPALESDTPDHLTALGLGALHFRVGELDTAVATLAALVESDSPSLTRRLAHLFLSLAAEARGQVDAARSSYRSALEIPLGESFWSLELAARLVEQEVESALRRRATGRLEDRSEHLPEAGR